jgi:hypothetical protein
MQMLPYLWGRTLEERVDEWACGSAAQDDQQPKQEQYDQNWKQPPLLIVSQKGQELSNQARSLLL